MRAGGSYRESVGLLWGVGAAIGIPATHRLRLPSGIALPRKGPSKAVTSSPPQRAGTASAGSGGG